MNREIMLKRIEEILFRHRANDRGNSNLNLFEDKEKLEEQDKYYSDLIISLFIEFAEELIGQESPKFPDLKGYTKLNDIIEGENRLRKELRQKLGELK